MPIIEIIGKTLPAPVKRYPQYCMVSAVTVDLGYVPDPALRGQERLS